MTAHRMTRTELARLSAKVASGKLDGHPYLAAFRKVAEGLLKMIWIQHTRPGTAAQSWDVPRAATIVVLGDDFDTSYGPTGFHHDSLVASFKRARGVLVQVADFKPGVIEALTEVALLGNVAVVVETRQETEAEWIAFINKHHTKGGTIVISPTVVAPGSETVQ